MNPEMLMIETDHDLRNSADMLVIDRVAKNIFHIPGVGRVQAITRPQGTPIEHTSIPFIISMSGATQQLNMSYMQDRMKDMLKMGDDMQMTVDNMQRMYGVMTGAHRRHRTTWSARPRRWWPPPTNCGTTSPISTISSGRSATTSTGNRTASTSRSAGDAVGVRHPRRDRQTQRRPRRRWWSTWTGSTALMPQMLTIMPPMIENMKTDADDDADHAVHHGRHCRTRWRRCRTTPTRWARPSTRPRTTTRSICRRRCSRTKSSSAA